MPPKVTVLMPVYNGEKYLREAIDSILSQTFTDFEFVIIDDCSTDGSVAVVNTYSDPRIKLVQNESNLGVTLSLNKGLDLARGEYIVRMDCDDVSLPERLAKQVAFMDVHPEIAVCGTWAKEINEDGHVIGVKEPPVGKQLELHYWNSTPIIHPSAIIRVAHLNGLRYDGRIKYAQDFDLWLRIKARFKIYNLAEHLLLYRIHNNSIGLTMREEQIDSAYETFRRFTGIQCISKREYISLAYWSGSIELHPIRRIYLMSRIARKIRQPYRAYLQDDINYTKRWLDPWFAFLRWKITHYSWKIKDGWWKFRFHLYQAVADTFVLRILRYGRRVVKACIVMIKRRFASSEQVVKR